MKKLLCENCRKLVNAEIKKVNTTDTIKGKEYQYIKELAYCPNCNMEIIENEVMDRNLTNLDIAYRIEEGIISKTEIQQILKKYKIGKKPLAKLLGWGEVTIIRYINGDMPTKIYSDELKKILNDANYMLKILEQNKNNITEQAYKTAYDAIIQIRSGKSHTMKDLDLVVQYIISVWEVTPLALQKMLYYAQGFYKAFFGNFLFEDNCEAWKHGPVFPSVFYQYKKYEYNTIDKSEVEINAEDFLDDDKKALLDVITTCFGYYNGKALEKMTYYEQPWIIARKGIPIDENSNNIILKQNIEEFFIKIKSKYEMINLWEIRKYSEELFNNVIILQN